MRNKIFAIGSIGPIFMAGVHFGSVSGYEGAIPGIICWGLIGIGWVFLGLTGK